MLLCSTDEPHIAVDAAKDGEVAGQRRYPVVLIIDVHHQQIRGISPYFIRNVYGKGRVTSFVGSEQLAVEVHLEGARLLDVLGDVVHDKNDSHKNPLLGTELVEELLGKQIRVRRLRELGLKAAKNRQR